MKGEWTTPVPSSLPDGAYWVRRLIAGGAMARANGVDGAAQDQYLVTVAYLKTWNAGMIGREFRGIRVLDHKDYLLDTFNDDGWEIFTAPIRMPAMIPNKRNVVVAQSEASVVRMRG